jgi:hypothetical protein
MEHAAPPNPAPEIAYAAVNAELSRSEPLWLYRMFLGITGVLIAETLFVFESGMKEPFSRLLLVHRRGCRDGH